MTDITEDFYNESKSKFQTLDEDKDGTIRADELKKAWPAMSDEEAAKLMARFDQNGDGKWQVDDFVDYENGAPPEDVDLLKWKFGYYYSLKI